MGVVGRGNAREYGGECRDTATPRSIPSGWGGFEGKSKFGIEKNIAGLTLSSA
jgi:hypothetical protein